MAKMNEDFSCSVASVGADQGIPCSGDMKAVVAKPIMPLQRRFKLKKKKKKKKHTLKESLNTVPFDILKKRFKNEFETDISQYIRSFYDIRHPEKGVELEDIYQEFEDDKLDDFFTKCGWYNTSNDYDSSLGLTVIRGENSLDDNTNGKCDFYAHVSPAAEESIRKNGLRPKSNNNMEKYPSRIYLLSGNLLYKLMEKQNSFKNVEDEEEVEWMVRKELRNEAKDLMSQLSEASGIPSSQYKIYMVKVPSGYKKYRDPAMSSIGVYVKEAIPAKFVK